MFSEQVLAFAKSFSKYTDIYNPLILLALLSFRQKIPEDSARLADSMTRFTDLQEVGQQKVY